VGIERLQIACHNCRGIAIVTLVDDSEYWVPRRSCNCNPECPKLLLLE
jgi:hypothetical protein